MTRGSGKHTKIIVYMTFKEKQEIREEAKRCGMTMSGYLLQQWENNKAMKDSKKFPPFTIKE